MRECSGPRTPPPGGEASGLEAPNGPARTWWAAYGPVCGRRTDMSQIHREEADGEKKLKMGEMKLILEIETIGGLYDKAS